MTNIRHNNTDTRKTINNYVSLNKTDRKDDFINNSSPNKTDKTFTKKPGSNWLMLQLMVCMLVGIIMFQENGRNRRKNRRHSKRIKRDRPSQTRMIGNLDMTRVMPEVTWKRQKSEILLPE